MFIYCRTRYTLIGVLVCGSCWKGYALIAERYALILLNRVCPDLCFCLRMVPGKGYALILLNRVYPYAFCLFADGVGNTVRSCTG